MPEELRSKADLICIHSHYVSLLVQTRISATELELIMELMHKVQRLGADEYRGSTGSKHDRHWVTINTHLMRHMKWYIQQFGIPRNYWVFAFESMLGEIKKYNARHKIHQSEGASMFEYQFSRVTMNILLYAVEPESYNEESKGEIFKRCFGENKRNQIITIIHDYDNQSDYFLVKAVKDNIQSFLAVEVEVGFDGFIKVEWTDLVPKGLERRIEIKKVDCCFDTLEVSGRYYLLNKKINN
jgi:hypothetical protein